MPNRTKPTARHFRVGRSTVLLSLITSPLVAALGCASDLTELDTDLLSEVPATEPAPAGLVETEAEQIERLRAENEAFIEERIREGRVRYEALTDDERAALETGLREPSPEVLRAEWLALENATLSAEEELAVRELFANRPEGEALHFRGRTLTHGDVLHKVDDLLAQSESAGAGEKALTVPGTYSFITNGQYSFRRPETNRTYYIVVANAVPQSIMDALLLGANAINSALSDDCITSNTLVPIRQSSYALLTSDELMFSSVIDFRYEPNVCGEGPNPASGCAGFPVAQLMMVDPGLSATRMRFGTFLWIDTESDDWNPARARDIIFHELTHTIGFHHRENYPGLKTSLDTSLSRVPGTPDLTTPTATVTTDNSLFTFPLSNDDKHALRKLYSGQCGYTNTARTIASVCSTTAEQNCQRHGATCEINGTGIQQCRWHHFKDSASCGWYSLGNWTTVNPVPGEAGSCIAPASSVAAVYSGEAGCLSQHVTVAQDLSGRCCAQGVRSAGGAAQPGVMFQAFGDAFSTTYLCSEQRNLWDKTYWNARSWEFAPPTEERDDSDDFIGMDPVTSGTAEGWVMANDDVYKQTGNRTDNMLIARLTNDEVRYGCLSTLVTTSDDDESGIVFGYQSSQNFFAFDVTPSVRRRIRRVVNGVSTDLSNVLINVQATWSPGIKLSVCFTDSSIHTFINNGSRVSVNGSFNFSGAGGRYPGLWNSWNSGARHEYLRSDPLIKGLLGQL